jgi:hypothetical protein
VQNIQAIGKSGGFFLSKKLKYVPTTMARMGNRDKQLFNKESTI